MENPPAVVIRCHHQFSSVHGDLKTADAIQAIEVKSTYWTAPPFPWTPKPTAEKWVLNEFLKSDGQKMKNELEFFSDRNPKKQNFDTLSRDTHPKKLKIQEFRQPRSLFAKPIVN